VIGLLSASHRLGRIAGIEIRVAWLLYAFLGLILALKGGRPGEARFLFLALVLALYPVCILVHELAHALVARAERVTVRRLLLHPLGGAAEFSGPRPGPAAEIRIALAGPAASLALSVLCFAPLYALEGSAAAESAADLGRLLYERDNPALAAAAALMGVNLVLALFNLLPAFPLDGGRIAASIAVLRLGHARGLKAAGRIAAAGLLAVAGCGIALLVSGRLHAGGACLLLASFLHSIGRRELAERSAAAGLGEAPGESWWAKRTRETAQRAEAAEKAELDRILAKVHTEGLHALTAAERTALEKKSRQLREERGR